MEQRELLEIIKQKFAINRYSEADQKKIEDYLTGISDSFEGINVNKGVQPSYWIIGELTEQFHSEKCKEMAKRAYRLLGAIAPSWLMQHNAYASHPYREYYEAGMPEDFVYSEITWRIQINFLNAIYYYHTQKKWMEGNVKNISGLAEAFPYYEKMIDDLVRKKEKEKREAKREEKRGRERQKREIETPEQTRTLLALKALGVLWYGGNKERKEKLRMANVYKNRVIKALLPPIKALLSKRGEKVLEEQTFSDWLINAYKKVDGNDMGLSRQELEQFLIGICYALYDRSERISEIFRLLLLGIETRLSLFVIDSREMYELLKELDISVEKRAAFVAERVVGQEFLTISELASEWLTECYREDWEKMVALCDQYKKEFREEAFPIHLILLREGAKDLEEEEMDRMFLNFFENHQKKRRKYDIYYKNIRLEGYTIFSQVPFPVDDLKLTNVLWDDPILWCAALMFEGSVIARNLYILYMKSYQEKNPYYSRICFDAYLMARKNFGRKMEVEKKGEAEAEANWYEQLGKSAGVKFIIEVYTSGGKQSDFKGFSIFVNRHKEEALTLFKEILKKQNETIRSYIEVLAGCIEFPMELLCSVLDHRLKSVIQYVEEILTDREKEARVFVEQRKNSKNNYTKEAASRLLKLWDEDKIRDELEKITDITELKDYLKNEQKPDEKKIPYRDRISLSEIRLRGFEEFVDPIILEYYLSEYMLLKKVQRVFLCDKIAGFLNKNDMRKLMWQFYQFWLEDGADTKKKNLLIPYAIHADNEGITSLKAQIDEWTEHARGALASFAVSAMALNRSDLTLMFVSSISKKYKNKQVKASAEAALKEAALSLNLTKEELEDKIVPNLGFSKERERIFCYGPRSFKAFLNEKLEIMLYDETGKQLKTLPKPGVKDDKEQAEEAGAAFKSLKKELKAVIKDQSARLSEALITGRVWIKERWESIFLDNPIMNGFAIGLIWEERDESGKILGTFRYLEDGSFNSVEEEEYSLSENSQITLLHPIDVEEDVRIKWEQQLKDYAIIQPIDQLSMPVYSFTEDEKKQSQIERFMGKRVYFGTIMGVMEKYGWKKTSITDGGSFLGYYYEDLKSGIGVQLKLNFVYVGMMANETVKLKTMEFYRAGAIKYGSYVYDEINDENRVFPKEVPEKMASFVLMVGEQIASKELD